MKKIGLLLLVFVLLFGCSDPKDKKESKIDLAKKTKKHKQRATTQVQDYDLSKYVAGHTSGIIMPTSPIMIRFAENIVEAEKIDKVEEEIGFEIEPETSGKLIWESRSVLIFMPDKIWEEGENYSVTVDIKPIIPKDVSIKPLSFSFLIERQRMLEFEGDFSEMSSNNTITYFGSTKFILPTSIEKLEKATTLKIKGKKIKIDWKGSETDFTFTSKPFARLDEKMEIDFKIDKSPLKLLQDFERESSLFSLHEMELILVKRVHNQQKPGIEIQFSGNLDLKQDLSGYFHIKPDVDFSLKKIENKVLLNGDFEFGKEYKVTIKKGILNRLGLKLSETQKKFIKFNDENPQIIFAKSGCFLPTSNDMKIQFRTMNLKNVHLTIKHVFEKNLNFFLQKENLDSSTTNSDDYYRSFERTGTQIYSEKISVGDVQNKWLLQELDLSKLIPEGDNGLYIVDLRFTKKDINYRGIFTGGNDYYSNPLKRGFYHRNGEISKPIILSDIGLTVKKSATKYVIYATDIISAKPLHGCKIELKTYQNQMIESKNTDKSGRAEFDIPKSSTYFIEGLYKGQRSFLKPNEMIWNTSNFDVGGVQYSSKGIRAYSYTERGVYRPGDHINLSMIFRTKTASLKDNHPVKIELKNPRNQVIQTKILKDGKDGFYNYSFETDASDPTGDWSVKIEVGGSVFYHKIKIETVVAEHLKLEMTPKSEKISFDMKELNIDFQANYLFGAPASKLNCEVDVEVFKNPSLFKIPKYKSFIFDNPTIRFRSIYKKVLEEKLDEKGFINFKWKFSKFVNAPSGLIAKLSSTVSESGGRSSKDKTYIKIDPFPAYVGMKSLSRRWKKVGKKNQFEFILLDPDGNEVVGENVTVRIYRNRYRWWWDYDNDNKHFKDNTDTELLQEMKFVSKSEPTIFEFTPLEYGKYFVEVTHNTSKKEGHSTGEFFWGSYWGNPSIKMQDAGIISLDSDKQKYNLGDIANIRFDAPANSSILVSLEKGDNIIDEYWVKGKGGKQEIQVPITKEMVPNIYCSISIIQPHSQTENDRPIRSYGIIPINVFDEDSFQKIILNTPKVLQPNKKFECAIQTSDYKKTQFTIAVVDEGLLSLTDFKSPNAWAEFYKKQLLGVKTYDNFGYVIGANNGDVFKTYSIGGDSFFDNARKDRLSPKKAKRFKPVCLFQGPIYTDENGYAKIEFKMPEYMGAVRIMAVSADGSRYGNVDKTVEVKQDIVLLATLPRVLAPGDKFSIPVEIFATEENVGFVDVSIETEGAINILYSTHRKLSFSKKESKNLKFDAEVPIKTGVAKVIINAKFGSKNVTSTTDIAIRPLSPRISKQITKVCKPNSTIDFDIPNDGILGTNTAVLSVTTLPKADLGKRVDWLIRYPYGCVEQTTSAVFPQLYLREFIKSENYNDENITNNINKAIERLKKFQLPHGGFSYWPGEKYVSQWGSNYAGHFLLSAKEAGYFVPEEMTNNWLEYIKRRVTDFKYQAPDYPRIGTQVYRLYLLAKAGKPEIGAMNYLRENHLNKLNDTYRWMFAAAYFEAGMKMPAKDISMTTGVLVKDYSEMSGTYGSRIRDKAIILDAMITLGEEDKSLKLYLSLSEQISQNRWYSTQSTAFVLLALGRYIQEHENDNSEKITGVITENNQKPRKVKTEKVVTNVDINKSFGKKVSFKSTTKKNELFVTMNWTGVPLISDEKDSFNGIKIKNVWKDDEGQVVSPNNLKQGDIITQYIAVTNLSDLKLENLALVQMLPSGWEIENERMDDNSNNNSFDSNDVSCFTGSIDYKTNKRFSQKIQISNSVDYVDIRDDRKMWFFSLNRSKIMILKMKIRAVTVGEFYMPATYIDAMYNDKYKASKAGQKLKVLAQ